MLANQIDRMDEPCTSAQPDLPFPHSSQAEGQLRELRCHYGRSAGPLQGAGTQPDPPQHGLTQAQLAKRVGTSNSAISHIESGQHAATPETLRKLATALDMRLVIGFERGPKKTPKRDLVVFG